MEDSLSEVEVDEEDEEEDEVDDAVASTTRYNPVPVRCSNPREDSSQTRCAWKGVTYCLWSQLL
jgi:hypothetical protein